ncbi:hypothetical protein H0O00_03465 [Candidatus Micrarchaeota archaeon]|nr:hypothetical protein [Candidatus Micrarchaeota archaeon]
MRGSIDRLLPVLLVLGLVLLFSFGCLEQLKQALGMGGQGPQWTDTLGPKVEEMNARIHSASSASAVANLKSELASLRTEAQADDRYFKYLTLIDAQDLTLEVLSTYMEYQTETAAISAGGVDCSKDYFQFISRLKSANATANAAVSKASTYHSSNLNSTADLLVSAISEADTAGMAVYAEMLELDLGLDCPVSKSPATTYTTPLSRQDAIALVVAEVVAQNDYYVYATSSSPLPAGTVVTSTRGDEEFDYTLASDTWFFFVDTDPFAPFDHDTFFVFIDVATAEYFVTNESYYPVINGISYFASMDSRLDASRRVYPDPSEGNLTYNLSGPTFVTLPYDALAIANPPAGTPLPLMDYQCCDGVGNKYALVMSGYDDPTFDSDTSTVYDYLKGQGYSDDDITYLTTSLGTPNSDGQTTLARVESAFRSLALNAECCDDVFIYLAGHGKSKMHNQYKNKKTGETKWASSTSELPGGMSNWKYTGVRQKLHRITVNPQFTEELSDGSRVTRGSPAGGRVLDTTIDAWLDPMKSCDITVMYLSCYSGVAAGNIKSPGRTVITPVGDNPAYGTTTAFNGWKPGGFFTQNFIKAKTDSSVKNAADNNGDGQVSDKEAFDWAKGKTKDYVRSKLGKDNTATWTDPERCWCCNVNCTEQTNWKCTVFEARNQPDCPECKYKRVGDYCKNMTPPIDQPPPNITNGTGNGTAGNGTTGGTGEQPPANAQAVCGDGQITGNEGCDYGSTSTNKCPEGYYCHDSCVCKKLETTVVCGDGRISVPSEDCDGGNVKFKICPEGYTCTICKCLQTKTQCGDGKVQAPEECDHGNSFTQQCPGGKVCSGCRCYAPGEVPPEEAYCGNNKREGNEECDGTDNMACPTDQRCGAGCTCTEEPGCGNNKRENNEECDGTDDSACGEDEYCNDDCICTDLCGNNNVDGNEECDGSDDAACGEDEYCSADCLCTGEAPECGDGTVNGNEECEEDSDCAQGETCDDCLCWQTPAYCGDGTKNGNEECDPEATPTGCMEPAVCNRGCDCISPPSLNCDSICGYTQGAESFGSTYTTSTDCMNRVKNYYGSRTCYLTCVYAYLYKSTNIAGSATCCCGMKKEFACSQDCKTCPGNQTCTDNAPSWYEP